MNGPAGLSTEQRVALFLDRASELYARDDLAGADTAARLASAFALALVADRLADLIDARSGPLDADTIDALARWQRGS